MKSLRQMKSYGHQARVVVQVESWQVISSLQNETYRINWGILTQAELNQIKNALSGTFYPCVILGETLTVYRGTLQYNLLGTLSDGVTYYKSASVSLIQQ